MIEIRDASANYWTGTGWATTWSYSPERGAYFVNDPQEGTFLERMRRGAFDDAASGRDAVELRREHDPNGPVFATTTAGTLRFEDMRGGLMLAAALSKTDPATVTAVGDIRSDTLTGLSVGMIVRADDWGTAADGRTALRTITSATLREVSFVSRPANPAATITSVRHEQRSSDLVEYRSVPLVVSKQPCPECDATGACPTCDGTGWADGDDDGDCGDRAHREGRRDFTGRELAALGKQGQAVWIGGHWAYPTPTRTDYDNAVTALGRTPGKNRQTVRKYLIGRAKTEGWPIPDSWNTDGTTKGSGRSTTLPRSRLDEFELELAALAIPGSRLVRQHRGPTERDKREHDWLVRRFTPWGVPE
jgi:HK97 family phage prohead protease